jgi:hypothetical protein
MQSAWAYATRTGLGTLEDFDAIGYLIKVLPDQLPDVVNLRLTIQQRSGSTRGPLIEGMSSRTPDDLGDLPGEQEATCSTEAFADCRCRSQLHCGHRRGMLTQSQPTSGTKDQYGITWLRTVNQLSHGVSNPRCGRFSRDEGALLEGWTPSDQQRWRTLDAPSKTNSGLRRVCCCN